MAKILFNPIDDFGIPLFKEPQWIDPIDYPQYANQFPKAKVKERTSNRKERSDKGKPRTKYNKVLRQARQDAKALEQTLAEVERFEKRQQRLDFSGESKSRAERRRAKRLQQIPNPRICPHCLKLKLKTKQWVIKNDFIGCKSCLWRKKLIPAKDSANGVSSNDCNQALE